MFELAIALGASLIERVDDAEFLAVGCAHDDPAKGVAITSDPAYLAAVAAEINDRPRKIFDWKKPSEVFTELVESHASTA
uniref:hypothetical protein n=1 Tax=Actinoplanes sp. RD1 TaxID=3064538 RepID=UPI002741C365|nr:hypothetical protein [Actinoplanes sp. RD1]